LNAGIHCTSVAIGNFILLGGIFRNLVFCSLHFLSCLVLKAASVEVSGKSYQDDNRDNAVRHVRVVFFLVHILLDYR